MEKKILIFKIKTKYLLSKKFLKTNTNKISYPVLWNIFEFFSLEEQIQHSKICNRFYSTFKKKFEQELIADIHLKEEGILRAIRQEKDLSKETEEKLKLYLENFLREFLENN